MVGLGNPGTDYAQTRHNIGFMVVNTLAQINSITLREKATISMGSGMIANRKIILAKPLTYMNRSDGPLSILLQKKGLCGRCMVVIHDDIDLDFGQIKIKEKGGHGGHKGIRAIMERLGGGDFIRIRMGIGRPFFKNQSVADFVLGRFNQEEKAVLEDFVIMACKAVMMILQEGVNVGMNIFNRKIILD